MSSDDSFLLPQEMIFYVLVAILFTGMVLFLAVGITGFKSKLVQTPPQLQAELIGLRFTTIPECLAYQDVHGVVRSGIVDPAKFTQEHLERCYYTFREEGFSYFNFRLQLVNEDKELMTNHYKLNDRDDFTLFKEVLKRTENGLEKDQLVIYVQKRTARTTDSVGEVA